MSKSVCINISDKCSTDFDVKLANYKIKLRKKLSYTVSNIHSEHVITLLLQIMLKGVEALSLEVMVSCKYYICLL